MITLERVGGSEGEVSVRCTTSNGSATSGHDYVGKSEVITWADGDSQPKSLTLMLHDDTTYEGDETVVLKLGTVTGAASLGQPAVATLTIHDDDPAPIGQLQLASTAYAIDENAGSVVITVHRVHGSGGAVSIDYATVNASAVAPADFTAVWGTLTWLDGQTGSRTIVVPIHDDVAYEGANESFLVVLSNPQGGITLSGASTAVVTITDDDPQPSEYNVGDGQPYPSIGSVPWGAVGAGSTVRIHWRAAAYHEKILISGRGSDSDPIRIVGVAGPNGERPVIDGSHASTSGGLLYPQGSTVASRSLLAVSRDHLDGANFKPGHIYIEGLELRQALALNTFTDANGTSQPYASAAACVLVEGGEHVTLRDCDLHHCGRGVDITSGNAEASVSRQIVVDGNRFAANNFNIHAEGSGVLVQHNQLSSPNSGVFGQNLRDRGAGTVIRYNWIEGSPAAFLIDIVDSSRALLVGDPTYAATFVYGNVLRNGPADGSSLLRYGGDPGGGTPPRAGTLYFFHNTVTVSSNRGTTRLFNLAGGNATVDARNNIFHAAGGTALQVLYANGNAVLGANWLSSGWTTGGHVSFDPGLIRSGPQPGFVDLIAADLRLQSTAAAADAGAALHAATIGVHDVTRQYVAPAGSEPRPTDASADLGAFEHGVILPSTPTPTGVRQICEVSSRGGCQPL